MKNKSKNKLEVMSKRQMKCELCESEFISKAEFQRHNQRKTACISMKEVMKLWKENKRLRGIEEPEEERPKERVTFGDEDIELKKKDVMLYETLNPEFLVDLIFKIYKENRSVLVSSISSKYCKVWEDNNWLMVLWIDVYEKIKKNMEEALDRFNDKYEGTESVTKRVESLKETLDTDEWIRERLRCKFINAKDYMREE